MYFFQKAGAVEIDDLLSKFKAYDELMKEQGVNQDVKYVESFTIGDTTYHLFSGNPIMMDAMLFFCYNKHTTSLFDEEEEEKKEELVYIYHDYIKSETSINIMRGYYETTIASFEELI